MCSCCHALDMANHETLRSWLEATKAKGMALGLTNTHAALQALELPAPTYETVHVAGSNGKGTLCATLSAALTLQGIPNLCFTSPHLVRVEERIRFMGRPVSPETFDDALARVHTMAETTGTVLTFFETTFLVAMALAGAMNVEVLILETGLGGRLDATQVAPATVTALTSISLEHTEVLGTTLQAIAAEKAAIARPGNPMVAQGGHTENVRSVITRTCQQAGMPELGEPKQPAALTWYDADSGATYMEQSRGLARCVWLHLKASKQFSFPEFSDLHWPGRMHRVASRSRPGVVFLLDGAHNPSGMEQSCRELPSVLAQHNGPWTLLLGSTPQMDMEAMLAPLADLCRGNPPKSTVITVPQGGRYPGLETGELAAAWMRAGMNEPHCIEQPFDAINELEQTVEDGTLVLSIGSLYMQGNVLEALGAVDDEALAVTAKQSNEGDHSSEQVRA